MVHHHLDDATILRYASGDLDEAFLVVVASHLSYCEECRHAVHTAEAVGGNLLDATDEAALSPDALQRMMNALDGTPDETSNIHRLALRRTRDQETVPLPLQRLIGSSLDDIDWKLVAPGVRKYAIELPSGPQSALYMLKISGGKKVPEHGHGGSEMTLVLSGAYTDDLGRFGPGDIADLDEDLEHQPQVAPGQPCICLVATEAPTRFKGVFSRLLQPVVGI